MNRYLLERYGYIQRRGKKYVPFSPLLKQFRKIAKSIGPKATVETKIDPAILHLSKLQRTFFEYLERRPGELVSKDAIAQVLWGSQWAEKYSDWAIDQLISTLRGKMKSTKLSGSIMTKKGEGIIYLPEVKTSVC